MTLDYVDSSLQKILKNSDIWVSCQGNYTKNLATGTYLSYNNDLNVVEASNEPTTTVEYDEWSSVDGYTLIKIECSGDCILAYEHDALHVEGFNTTDGWAQWNKQPLDRIAHNDVNNSNNCFYGCDLDHPFRLITRMSGKAIYALTTSKPSVKTVI